MTDNADTITLLKIATYRGPNLFDRKPVIVWRARFGATALANAADRRDRMRERYPHWIGADRGVEDPLALLGHLATEWARGALNEVRGHIDPAGSHRDGSADTALLWLGYHNIELAEQAMVLALRVIGDPADRNVDAAIGRLLDDCKSIHPDLQARMMMAAGDELDVPSLPVAALSRIRQFGWGRNSRLFFEASSNLDGAIAHRIAGTKHLTKCTFRLMGIPTPRWLLAGTAEDLTRVPEAVGWPCVVKPIDRGGGKGITAGVNGPEDLHNAFGYARQFSNMPIMVEAFVQGEDYRLTVLGGRLLAAVRRRPPVVTGDGKRTIRQLVEELNQTRSFNRLRSAYRLPVAFEPAVLAHLGKQNFSPATVLGAGEKAVLRSTANMSTGGSSEDVTKLVHPQTRQLAEHLASSLGINAAGVDLIAEDITAAPSERAPQFIEVNLTPGMDVVASAGIDEVRIGTALLGEGLGRIPTAVVIAPAEMIDALAARFEKPGLAVVTPTGSRIGAIALNDFQIDAPDKVNAVLRFRGTEALLILWSPEELITFGFPLDRTDVTILYKPTLPAEWQAVINSASSKVISARGTAAIANAVRSALRLSVEVTPV